MRNDEQKTRVDWVGSRLILGALVALAAWVSPQRVAGVESGQTVVAHGVREQLEASVRTLAETIGPRSYRDEANLSAAADFVTRSFEAAGYTVAFQPYEVKGRTYRNIIAERQGTVEPDRILIVGAHYDTVEGTPGADDNASGVAVLLELARLHAETRFRKTVRFVAFTLEEPPFFRSRQMGSRVYARSLKERGEQIEGMLCLEMVGYYSQVKSSQSFPFFWLRWRYPTTGNFITVVSNSASAPLQALVRDALKAHAALPVETFTGPWWIPGVDLSDHSSFWKEGYPAVMLTDTAFYRNPHYHRATDRPETLDYGSMAELTRSLFQTLMELDRASGGRPVVPSE